jgi:hypothetical protein
MVVILYVFVPLWRATYSAAGAGTIDVGASAIVCPVRLDALDECGGDMQMLWRGVFAVALGVLFRVGLRHVPINGG